MRILQNEFQKRKARALWFVSNCGADFRNKFALALKSHIDVRIFGKCREQFVHGMKSQKSSIYSLIINLIQLPFDIISFIFNLNSDRLVDFK